MLLLLSSWHMEPQVEDVPGVHDNLGSTAEVGPNTRRRTCDEGRTRTNGAAHHPVGRRGPGRSVGACVAAASQRVFAGPELTGSGLLNTKRALSIDRRASLGLAAKRKGCRVVGL